MFEIHLTESFAKELKKLQKHERTRIKEKLRNTTQAPFRYFQRLSGHELYRIRIGKFRAIASISFQKKIITLLSIKQRRKAYRDL